MYFLESQIEGFVGYCIGIKENGEIHTGTIKVNYNETDMTKLDLSSYPTCTDD